LKGDLLASSLGNNLIIQVEFNHENIQYPIEILIYQSKMNLVAVVTARKLPPQGTDLHQFPLKNWSKMP